MTDMHGRRILIVEDGYFVAADLARDLRRLGMEVVGPVGSVAGALALIRTAPPLDGAVLDVKLHGETSYAVAEALQRADTPLLFATGCDAWTIDDRFRGVALCEKPVRPADVVATLFGDGAGRCLSRGTQRRARRPSA